MKATSTQIIMIASERTCAATGPEIGVHRALAQPLIADNSVLRPGQVAEVFVSDADPVLAQESLADVPAALGKRLQRH